MFENKTGYRYCLSKESQNYFMSDLGTRHYLCKSLSIRYNGVYAWLGCQKGSLKHRANKRRQWVSHQHNQWLYNHQERFAVLKMLK